MGRLSLRLRLVAAGALAVVVALGIATGGLALLYDRHAERAAVQDLQSWLEQLLAGIEPGPDGQPVSVRVLDGPRFATPYSGYYWQMRIGSDETRSRSLWDMPLDLPAAATPEAGARVITLHTHTATLLAVDRSVVSGSTPIRVTVALDRAGLAAARRAFLSDLAPFTAVLALVLTAAGAVQLMVGLRPLSQIGAKVTALRSGKAERLGQGFPAEVRPLAAEIDALLDSRAAEAARARTRAADLAHGLKTPLQALMGEALRLRARGDPAADGVDQIAQTMRRHVERELARARTRGRAPAFVDPVAVIASLVAVLRRTPAGAAIHWDLPDAVPFTARIDRDDLTEVLGALLENAARHARANVAITLSATDTRVRIRILDDGPGIADASLALIRKRGVRMDSSGPGDGLGLAIAGEILESAGGTLDLVNSDAGFRVTVELAKG